MAIVGLGLDVCSIERISKVINGPRGDRFLRRVFTEAERSVCAKRSDCDSAYAARFAAKEALVKALGAPPGIRWTDMEVSREQGAPRFILSGAAKRYIEERGQSVWLAITHDAGVAAATVILEET